MKYANSKKSIINVASLLELLFVLLIPCISIAQEPTLPSELRFAKTSDYLSVHPAILGTSKPRIIADFDGNNLQDIAALIVSTSSNNFGLYVFLQIKVDTWKTIPIAEVHDRKGESVSDYGLFPVEPGIQGDNRFCLQKLLSLPCEGDFYAVKSSRNKQAMFAC